MKSTTAEELLEKIRESVEEINTAISEARSKLKDVGDAAEDIEYTYAMDLYNLAEREKEEREINATSLDLVWEEENLPKLIDHINKYQNRLGEAKKIRIRFYEILEKKDEQN